MAPIQPPGDRGALAAAADALQIPVRLPLRDGNGAALLALPRDPVFAALGPVVAGRRQIPLALPAHLRQHRERS